MSAIQQTSFTTPMERAREVIARCAHLHTPDHITLAVSGGTDSVVAADLMCRFGPEYGFVPDSITHINTGAGIPQSRLTARVLAEIHGLEWIEQGYRKERDSLAYRVLEHGWPGGYAGSPMTGGHGLEWANRKDKPMDEVYVTLNGQQVWVSGARKLESKKRQGNVPDSGVERDRPYRVWCSPICGWTTDEKRAYIRERGLPVSEAYLVLGFSGECTACAFDESGLLTNIDLLSPELGHALRTLAVWLYQRVRRGDVDLAPKRLCWGWEPEDEEEADEDQQRLSDDESDAGDAETARVMVGCDEDSCATRESPGWIRALPDSQLIDRNDVEAWWAGDFSRVVGRFASLRTDIRSQPKEVTA